MDAGAGSNGSLDIVVGRTLTTPSSPSSAATPSYFVGEVQNNQVTITYSVYNEQSDPETGVLLATTLQPGVTVANASSQPNQSGQNLTWSLGTINAFDSASVTVTVNLPGSSTLQLDAGAHAVAMLDGNAVSNTTSAATLSPGNPDPSLLASTTDADTTDPFIKEEAAALKYDPSQIFNFLQTQIGYNSYTGSLRGARGTLWSAAGNALDVASLGVALLRASGIPARYVQGALPVDLAQQLIASMFPTPDTVIGLVPSGVTPADPVNDPQLLAETEDHYWIEFGGAGGFQDMDPLIAGSQIGQAFAPVTTTFAAVPTALDHTVEVQLQSEMTSPGLFGAVQNVTTVLDQTFTTAQLVGRPITLAQNVTSSTIGAIFSATTNTYTPYLIVQDESGDPTQAELMKGQDIQEVISNFPFGSEILTGVFLNIISSGPGVATQTFEKTLVDRIGFAARQNGGPAAALNVSANSPPALSDTDTTTIDVLAGLQNPNSQQGLINEATAAANQAQAGASDPNDPGAVAALFAANVAITREYASAFQSTSDKVTGALASNFLVKAYFDQPRITIVSQRTTPDPSGKTATVTLSVDLRNDTIRSIPFPGQNPIASQSFQIARGIMEGAMEDEITGIPVTPTGAVPVSTTSVFQAAAAQGIAITTFAPSDIQSLDLTDFSPEAKARISQALAAGDTVMVPAQNVTLNGLPTIAWYEINPTTGQTVAVTSDGGHQGILEWTAIITLGSLFFTGLGLLGTGAVIAQIEIQANDCFKPAAPGSDPVENAKAIRKCLDDILKKVDNLKLPGIGGAVAKIGVLAYIGALKGLGVLAPAPPPPTTKSITASDVADDDDTDDDAAGPPVALSSLLYSPEPLDALTNLTGPGPLVVAAAPDPTVTVPFNGAQLPTAFRLGILNQGSTPETYALSFANVPAGFAVLSSLPQVTIAPGQTVEVGFYIVPTGAIPAPQTQLSFQVTAASTSDSSIAQTQTVNFTVPEIDAVSITAITPGLSTSPGVGAADVLTITNTGNVAENNITLIATGNGLAIAGLAPLSLAPNQSMTETVTITPDASEPLNSLLDATITAIFGPPAALTSQSFDIPVEVAVPGASAIASASVAAEQLGDTDLSNRLNDLSAALTSLVQSPTSAVAQSQAGASLNAVISLLSDDPVLNSLVPALTTDGAQLAQATTANAVQAATSVLGNDLGTLGTTLTDKAAHGLTLGLVVNTLVGQPQSPTNYQLVIQNTGNATTTYDLTVSGLPSGVTASLSQTSITLSSAQVSPGSNGVFTVAITSNSTTDLSPFSFTVTATAEGATEVHATVVGSFAARPAFVQVTSVTPSPTFANPGGMVDVQARLLNAVNKQQQAEVSYTVTDSGGTVLFTSTPVITTLNVLTTLTTVDLGNLDTTGFALGEDTITVTVADATGTPIPGATGTGALLIGTPVTATLSASPNVVASGTSTVTNTLTVTSQQTIPGALGLLGQAAVAGATDVVRNGDFLYVAGSAGISVFNIAGANLSAPQLVRVVGSATNLLEIHGNLLVAARYGYLSTKLDTYSLTDSSNPQFLGTTGEIPYGSATQIVVTDTDVFVAFVNLVFDSNSHVVLAQTGGVFAVNITNPAAPFFDGDAVSLKGTPAGRDGVNDGVLFNDNGTTNDGVGVFPPIDTSGGNQNAWDMVQVSPTILLLMGSSSTGGQSQVGSALVRVIDISDPRNMRLVRDITIPGAVQAYGVAVDGDTAVVTATQGGWQNGSLTFTGNIVLATLDLSDPANPLLVHTEVLGDAARGISFDSTVGAGLFAFGTGGTAGNKPTLYLVDAADPNNPVLAGIDAPAALQRISGSGNLVFTTDLNSLIVYQILASPGIPVTAQVTIPTGAGVSVVPGSFSIAPSNTITGNGTETLQWDLALSASNTSQTISWQDAVTGVQPGQSLPVAQDASVAFSSQGTSSTLSLPDQFVVGQQIIGLAPASQSVAPGAAASYTVTLVNPTSSPVTYNLSVQGVPAQWVGLPGSVVVAANGTTNVPLALTAAASANTSDYGFSVTATDAAGASGSVSGDLVLQGAPVIDADSHGIVVGVTPTLAVAGQGTSATYTIRLTNTGSADATFALSISGLAAGVSATFGQTSVDVPAGTSNFRDISLLLTTTAGATLGTSAFTVTATSTDNHFLTNSASGTLNVVSNGVHLAITPNSGVPGGGFQLVVTNTGSVTDTFDLALAGPAAPIASLAQNVVTLAPGASRSLAITTQRAAYALAGALPLMGIAVSVGNQSVHAETTAMLTAPSTSGVTASLSPSLITIPKPGPAEFLIKVKNTGNAQEFYTARIVSTSGPVTATLVGVDGLPTTTIPTFLIPPLGSGTLILNANLSAVGSGAVTIEILSLSNGAEVATVTATVNTPSAIVLPPVDGPAVTGVLRYGIHFQPTTIVVAFDEPLDPISATNPNSYIIIDPHGHRVPIRSAVYDAANNTVILSPSRLLNFHLTYKLTIDGVTPSGVKGSFGQLLDGKDTGKPGSNYVTRVTRKNLVLGKPTPSVVRPSAKLASRTTAQGVVKTAPKVIPRAKHSTH